MLDHRLKEHFDNGNGKIAESADAITLQSFRTATPQPKLPPHQPKPQSKPTFFKQIQRRWENLSVRTKLALLLAGSAALPVIAVTQGLVAVNRNEAIQNLQKSLEQDGKSFANEYVLWTQVESQSQAENLAKLVQATNIDLSNPVQVSDRRTLLQNSLQINNGVDPETNKNFQIFTDAQGKTVAQDIQILAQDLSSNPALPTRDTPLTAPKYQRVSLPLGTNLSDIPIVKNALKTERPLAGMELLKSQSLQRLGLEKQANIGLRAQPTNNLPTPKQPFPQGTYNIDNGKAGLTSMAVYPVKINNKLVGTVIVGSVLNRNYGLVDKFSQNFNIPTATVFAQDWRLATNVPYADGQSRAIGTRVSREVAEKVLNQGKDFSGQANIVGKPYLTFYTPLYDHQKELNPTAAKPVGIAYIGETLEYIETGLRKQQLIAYSIGGGMLLLAGLIALPIASSFARPLRRLSSFAQQVAAGNQGVRLETSQRSDEIGILAKEMNAMAVSIDANQEQLRQEAERVQLFADITSFRTGDAQEIKKILDTAVAGARQRLNADRVVVYRFKLDWSGYIAAESVLPGFPQALKDNITDPCIPAELIEAYRNGRVVPTNNTFETNYSPEHKNLLERLQIKANLVTPILQNGQLFGLLIAHYCTEPHVWQQSEIDFLTQLAAQVGLPLDRVGSLEKITKDKENLQKRALELLMEVDPLSKGDLTIRASVTEDEIGTVADSYNSTIGSLRKIVTQVQAAARQVAGTTSSSESSVQELSQEALRQAEEIAVALDQIQEMSDSIRAVAVNAERAELAVKQAAQTVESGDAAMNRTVDGFMTIRETVAQTSKKVKRLGESSQKISKVVNLIGTFADQTNLLALNAAIEAANAGEQGRGFAVVADRVRSLARQSTEATVEIEKLVNEIQTETNEVVAAMEAGTEQVVTGTKLVDETRQSLNQISAVSIQLGALVQAIASAAAVQSQASESVTQTMSDVAAISVQTSTEATQVTASFKELLAVAQELQATAGQFKVS